MFFTSANHFFSLNIKKLIVKWMKNNYTEQPHVLAVLSNLVAKFSVFEQFHDNKKILVLMKNLLAQAQEDQWKKNLRAS